MKTENPATQTSEVVVAEKSENGVIVVDLNGQLPDLSQAESYPFDLMANYWTPEAPGEMKKVFFDKIENRPVQDQQTGAIIDLECAHFIETVNGEVKTISNGSKRLVGALEANNIQRGTPLMITYLGKKKNKSNGFHSDNWSIKLLRVSI